METNNLFYDKDFRSKIRSSDKETFKKLITDTGGDAQVKVVTNSRDTTYVVIPDVAALGSIDLNDIQAAKAGTTSCVGSVASASTFGTICGSFTSIASASTLGTAGTVK